MGVGPNVPVLRAFFQAHPGGEAALNLLSRFPQPERRIFLAAKSMDGYRRMQFPGDVGAGMIADLDRVFREALLDPKSDRAWLVRAASSLFGCILWARLEADWEEPRGHPIFMALQPRRPLPVLISPLRLALDAVFFQGPVFVDTWAGLFRFRAGQKDLPHHIFRVDPAAAAAELRTTWQSAWSLVAACGHYDGNNWDLDFSPSSLRHLGTIVARGEAKLSDRVRLGVVSVDRDPSRRNSWLTTAARAYLGEVFRQHLGGRWIAPDSPREVARVMRFDSSPRPLDMADWIKATSASRQEDLLATLAVRLEQFKATGRNWPTP